MALLYHRQEPVMDTAYQLIILHQQQKNYKLDPKPETWESNTELHIQRNTKQKYLWPFMEIVKLEKKKKSAFPLKDNQQFKTSLLTKVQLIHFFSERLCN